MRRSRLVQRTKRPLEMDLLVGPIEAAAAAADRHGTSVDASRRVVDLVDPADPPSRREDG